MPMGFSKAVFKNGLLDHCRRLAGPACVLAAGLVLYLFALTTALWAYDLGGPCQSGANLLEQPALWDRYAQLAAAGQWPQALELRKRIIRLDCENHYAWADMPLLHLKCNQPRQALEALEEMYLKRRFPFVEGLLNPPCGTACTSEDERLMVAFRQSEPFASSNVARQMKLDRERYWQRKGQLLERFRQLEPARKPPAVVTLPGIVEGSPRRKAQADTPLVQQPDNSRTVASVKKGEQVTVLSVDVRAVPRPVGMIHDVRVGEITLKAGDILFQLDILDDGSQRYWKEGRIFTADLGTTAFCPFPGESCAAEYLFSDKPVPEPETWLKIRTSRNAVGWTQQADHFD